MSLSAQPDTYIVIITVQHHRRHIHSTAKPCKLETDIVVEYRTSGNPPGTTFIVFNLPFCLRINNVRSFLYRKFSRTTYTVMLNFSYNLTTQLYTLPRVQSAGTVGRLTTAKYWPLRKIRQLPFIVATAGGTGTNFIGVTMRGTAAQMRSLSNHGGASEIMSEVLSCSIRELTVSHCAKSTFAGSLILVMKSRTHVMVTILNCSS